MDYRWNLLAYRDNDWPFSCKVLLDKAPARLHRSFALADYNFKRGYSMGYQMQSTIFSGLEPMEKKQLEDWG